MKRQRLLSSSSLRPTFPLGIATAIGIATLLGIASTPGGLGLRAAPNTAREDALKQEPEHDSRSKQDATSKLPSVSCGSVNRGGLGNAAQLVSDGDGFAVPSPWLERERRFGTDELVGLIERVAKTVLKRHPGAVLGVGDMSRQQGGAISEHRSHQSGRDVDLIFYAIDENGDPLPPIDSLPFYRGDGRATHARAPVRKKIETRWFDHERNWALIAALADDVVEVERIFVSLRIYRWLVAAGEKAGDDEAVAAVKDILRVGKSGEDHGDHFHVRLKCTDEDLHVGLCRPYLAPRQKGGKKWRWGIRCPRS